mmetsp:Transcript_11558/g.44837  ORF Transcript_11558/g.44837 Transcript_11558/m.44837 type:complete len:269 (+) Transcript_11558:1381-2187(+)
MSTPLSTKPAMAAAQWGDARLRSPSRARADGKATMASITAAGRRRAIVPSDATTVGLGALAASLSAVSAAARSRRLRQAAATPAAASSDQAWVPDPSPVATRATATATAASAPAPASCTSVMEPELPSSTSLVGLEKPLANRAKRASRGLPSAVRTGGGRGSPSSSIRALSGAGSSLGMATSRATTMARPVASDAPTGVEVAAAKLCSAVTRTSVSSSMRQVAGKRAARAQRACGPREVSASSTTAGGSGGRGRRPLRVAASWAAACA